MPKRTDIHKIMVIGSGPIVIGQAAEFDYAGTQACLALREEGYEVLLVNSNPATIMTDPAMADKVYMEPLTAEYVARILRRERPDALVPGIGGQTGLNLAMELSDLGVLEECGVELLGTSRESIRRAEDREEFKALCQSLGLKNQFCFLFNFFPRNGIDINGYALVWAFLRRIVAHFVIIGMFGPFNDHLRQRLKTDRFLPVFRNRRQDAAAFLVRLFSSLTVRLETAMFCQMGQNPQQFLF